MEATSALSQFEIDSVMTTMAQNTEARLSRRGVGGQPSVKLYDFRRPDKLSKDHIRTLQMMHEHYARILSSSLSAYLRIPVQAFLTEVEQSSSDEYMERISEPTVLTLVSLPPLGGSVLLSLNVEVAFAILDRLLGGEGRGGEQSGEVTDIELSLLESVAGTFLSSLTEAWANVVTLEPVVDEISLDPQFLQRALPNDSVVIFALEMSVQETQGLAYLSIPYSTLEPILSKLSAQFWFARGVVDGSNTGDWMTERIRDVSIPIRAELGNARVTLGELSDLQPGDVITLGTSVEQEITLCIGDEAKLRGRAGTHGNRMAVRISQWRGDPQTLEMGVQDGQAE